MVGAGVRVEAMAAMAVLGAASQAPASDAPFVTDALPGRPGLAYLDLLRAVIPDLAANPANHDAEGHLTKRLRHIGGHSMEGDAPDPVVVNYIEALKIRAGGKARLLILADLGPDPDRAQDTALLALYDDSPTPKLLDAVDVATDRDTSFAEPAKIALSPNDDAVVTYSEHSNSGQSYQGRTLILVRGDRFREIDEVFTLADNGCGWRREEAPVFSTRPGRPYAEIRATVTETLKHSHEDCGDETVPRAYTRTWRGVWRWDFSKADFVNRLKDFDRLDKINEARF